MPTRAPTTAAPTRSPTNMPTRTPTTAAPTQRPTNMPTPSPPTAAPTSPVCLICGGDGGPFAPDNLHSSLGTCGQVAQLGLQGNIDANDCEGVKVSISYKQQVLSKFHQKLKMQNSHKTSFSTTGSGSAQLCMQHTRAI
jgi:hypothetical protein